MKKSPLKAFVLSFIPGVGHYYVGRSIRAVIYAGIVFGALLMFVATMTVNSYADGALLFFFIVGMAGWAINMMDMLLFLLTRSVHEWPINRRRFMPNAEYNTIHPDDALQRGQPFPQTEQESADSFRTIVLSVIPGLGHFQLGLMHRGMAFLLSFFGLFAMILFLSMAVFHNGFMVFLFALPVIWLYSLFDAVQLMKRKQQGETLEDRTIFEEFEEGRQDGRKSKTLASILSILPGAGHLYLGLQRRGLQLMAGFLITIYMLDSLRLSLFLFLVPIIWCYSFFDALQYVSRQEREEPLNDTPLVDWLGNHQKWVGIGLLVLGVYYLFDQLILGLIQEYYPSLQLARWFRDYFQTFLLGTLLIGGGMRLIMGGKRREQR